MLNQFKLASALVIISVLASFSLGANAQQFRSTEAQVPLIELYTSEGCSSCPPADRWLASLKEDQGLWSKFVPAAFHVDYWDYIGWKDPYASKQYSQRQRRYAKEFNQATVYTPGMRKAGKEWRSWRVFGNPENKHAPKVGQLQLNVAGDGSFTAQFDDLASVRQQNLQLTVAILGLGLISRVTTGENSGKQLNHDFVVLGITTVSVDSVSGRKKIWSGSLPEKHTVAKSYAVAAWVVEGGSQVPIQVVGGELAGFCCL